MRQRLHRGLAWSTSRGLLAAMLCRTFCPFAPWMLAVGALVCSALAVNSAQAQPQKPPQASAAPAPARAKKRASASANPCAQGALVALASPTQVESSSDSAASSPPQAAQPKARGARKAKERKADALSSPAFRMLPTGGSQLSVVLERNVPVYQCVTGSEVRYIFKDVHVSLPNNRHPLVTQFFNTPIGDARLMQVKGDVHLVIDLRSSAQPQARLVAYSKGPAATLEVNFAPGAYYTEPARDPQRGTRTAARQSSSDVYDREGSGAAPSQGQQPSGGGQPAAAQQPAQQAPAQHPPVGPPAP